MANNYVIIITTTSNKAEAESIASALLENKLCACVQMLPINSMYWWRGKLEKSEEVQLLIKTKVSAYQKVENAIKKLHSYDVPEIVMIDIKEGSKEYLNWVDEEVKI